MNTEQHIAHLKNLVSMTFGIPTDQITHWDALDRLTKEKIAACARVDTNLIHDYSWVAMDSKVREKLSQAAARLFNRGTESLQKIGRFVNSANA
jgi:hypothetical protein